MTPLTRDSGHNMNKVLEVSDLSVSFVNNGKTTYALNEISFSLYSGEIIGIVGESGSGKSVLVQTMLKLLESPPCKITGGSVLFENKDLINTSEQDLPSIRGNKIGMVFQNPLSSLNPTIKIGKQIIEPMIIHRRYSKSFAKKKAIELLRKVGISNAESRYDQYPYELSGGVCQRIAIAIAISCDPKVLIADEPTTALDVTIQAQVLDLIAQINQDLQTSVILISHDISVVANLCDRVLVMYGGSIIEQGQTFEVLNSPKHPYTKLLLESVPSMEKKRSDRLVPIKGIFAPITSDTKGCPFASRCPHLMQICRQEKPPVFSKGHEAACWLLDQRAKI